MLMNHWTNWDTSWHIPRGILVLYSGHIRCGYALWRLQWVSNTQNNVFWMRKRLLAHDNAVLNYTQSLKFKICSKKPHFDRKKLYFESQHFTSSTLQPI